MAAGAASALIPHIHHELQEQGSMLCAQHALNALLQGNYYDPSQLAEIAKRLDELEHSNVDEATWNARDEASLNMDDTGYFSVAVLESALQVWGISLIRWRSEEMRHLQPHPEEQLAFVLNLESHWFTIRSFTGGYWFNLNSFLAEPSWVGTSYLGALLQAAESEGYSIFVARATAEHAIGNFRSSPADECAAMLPAAGVLDQDTTVDTNSAALGLRPSAPAGTTSSTDEEADLQAALQASLLEDKPNNNARSVSSRMQSPSIAGQRRTRMGQSAEGDSADDQEETDAHVDAIAPSRRRARGLAFEGSSSAAQTFVLPQASGGRRRPSRQYQHSDEDDHSSSWLSPTGGAREAAINVDDEGSSRRNAITIADDDDDDEEILAASSAPRSPFLNPVLAQLGGSNNSDDDFHSVSSGGAGELGESLVEGDINALHRQTLMQSERRYDDEDAELQAALAASMRDSDPSIHPHTDDQVGAASWLNEEDARAIREAQASFQAPSVSRQSSRSSPPPADVERIARMRAEALQKTHQDTLQDAQQDTTLRGNVQSEDEDSSDEEPQMSPEEMRRARLARFGG